MLLEFVEAGGIRESEVPGTSEASILNQRHLELKTFTASWAAVNIACLPP